MSEREDFNTGSFCLTCGGDGAGCAKCAVVARDAEWRAAVERVREENCGPRTATLSAPVHSALDTLLAAMEVPDDAQ